MTFSDADRPIHTEKCAGLTHAKKRAYYVWNKYDAKHGFYRLIPISE
jgi:hypothetical protein